MSTRIVWGMLFSGGTLDAAWHALDGLRPEGEALVTAERARALAEAAVARIDAAVLAGTNSGDALGAAWDAVSGRGGRGSPDHDFGFRVVLCPHAGRVYGAAFVGRRAYGAWLLGQPFVEDYSWDNSASRPDDVSPAAWDERGAAWRGILAGAPCGRLSRRGVVLEFHDRHDAIGPADVIAAAPSRADRVRRAARDRVLDLRTRATGGTVPAAVAAAGWLSGPEGAAALAAESARAEALLPDLTESTLRGTP